MKLTMNRILFLFLFSLAACASSELKKNYPAHWWQVYPDSSRAGSWEILPHEAADGELILSKKNELGVFSNFGLAPFVWDRENYASIEALWQMMKYPDPSDKFDIRNKYASEYPYTREQVKTLDGFIAKKAGDDANIVNKKYGINWVSYNKKKFNYKDQADGQDYHYQIIKAATVEKINQNPEVKKLLLSTKGLILKPDHDQGLNPPPSYKYFDILMLIRDSK